MLSADSAFFYHDWSYRAPEPVKGGPWVFLRSASPYEWNGKRFRPRVAGGLPQLRGDPLSWAGLQQGGVLLEPAAIQKTAAPFDFANAAWTLNNGLTRADASSLIVDRVASKLTTAGASAAQSISDVIGTFTGSPETATCVVEGGNHATCEFGLHNETDTQWVHRAQLTFATGAIAETAGNGTGRARRAIKLADIGPNNGKVYLVRVHAGTTAGKSRGIYFYNDVGAVAAGEYSYLHYIGHEEAAWGSYPFLTAILRDDLTAPPIPAGVGFAGCLEFVAGERTNMGSGVTRSLLHIGDVLATNPRFVIAQSDASNAIVVTYDDGTTTRTVTLSVTVVEGDRVVVTWLLAANGTLYAQCRVNETGALVRGSSATGGIATTWGGTTPRVRIGHASSAGANPNRVFFGRLSLLRTADFVDATDHVSIHRQCRLFRLTPTGKLLRAA